MTEESPTHFTAPSWRMAAGLGLMLLLIIMALFLVFALRQWLIGLPVWLQLLIFIGLGVAWIAPLKPLLAWMEKRG
jgi:cytochrome bd-type quinol oxidase subunit 1